VDNFKDFFEIGMDRGLGIIWKFEDGIILNVGSGNKKIENSIPLDYPEWDADVDSIPYEDESVVGIYCYHFLEHVKKPVKVLLEFQRVLKIGGLVNIVVPYYNSQMQNQDLDHKNRFCEESWRVLFNNPYYNKNRIDWRFNINFNFICGLVERNLALLTQLEKI
jgi:ubiquinone/menaquinone biosynthesis C-methylase UbiE